MYRERCSCGVGFRDPDYCSRLGRRLQRAVIVHRSLYGGTALDVKRRREEIDDGIRQAWCEHIEGGRTAESYRATVGAYVASCCESDVAFGVSWFSLGHGNVFEAKNIDLRWRTGST